MINLEEGKNKLIEDFNNSVSVEWFNNNKDRVRLLIEDAYDKGFMDGYKDAMKREKDRRTKLADTVTQLCNITINGDPVFNRNWLMDHFFDTKILNND